MPNLNTINKSVRNAMQGEPKSLSQKLIDVLERNPNQFVRCDRDGKENRDGKYWRVRPKRTRYYSMYRARIIEARENI
jgi:hypothetical protein